jgi:hypothetical protein
LVVGDERPWRLVVSVRVGQDSVAGDRDGGDYGPRRADGDRLDEDDTRVVVLFGLWPARATVSPVSA